MFLSQFGFSLSLVPFVALPARESWPYLCTSAVLGAGYMVFLNAVEPDRMHLVEVGLPAQRTLSSHDPGQD